MNYCCKWIRGEHSFQLLIIFAMKYRSFARVAIDLTSQSTSNSFNDAFFSNWICSTRYRLSMSTDWNDKKNLIYPITTSVFPLAVDKEEEEVKDDKEGNHDLMTLFEVVGSPFKSRRESSAQADMTSGWAGNVYWLTTSRQDILK